MRKIAYAVVLMVLSISCGYSSPTEPSISKSRPSAARRGRSTRRRPAPAPAVTPAALLGAWGGQHVLLQFDGQTATLEFDCASGSFAGPLTLDSQGNFEARGSFTPGHGGPTRIGDTTDTRPARYVGTTDGSKMTLTIFEDDAKQTIGRYELGKGLTPRIFRCY